MNTLKYISLLITLCLLGSACSQLTPQSKYTPPKWESEDGQTNPQISILDGNFVSSEGHFSINIPHLPSQTQLIGPNRFDKSETKDRGKIYIWRFDGSAFTVMYSYLEQKDLDDVDETLKSMANGVRNGVLRQSGTFLKEVAIGSKDRPGTELHFRTKEGGSHISRNFIVGNFGYLVTGAFIDNSQKDKVIAIIDSFKPIVVVKNDSQ